MALPVKKSTRRSKGNRRSHFALKGISLAKCNDCGTNTRPHHACPTCGNYRNTKKKQTTSAKATKK